MTVDNCICVARIWFGCYFNEEDLSLLRVCKNSFKNSGRRLSFIGETNRLARSSRINALDILG